MYMNIIIKIDQNGNISNFANVTLPACLGWGNTDSCWPLLVGSWQDYPIVKILRTGVVRPTAGATTDKGYSSFTPSSNIIALCGDSQGNFYFMDWSTSQIRKIPATAGEKHKGDLFAGHASEEGDVDGSRTTARFRGLGNTGGTNHMRYDRRTNSIYFYDPGNFKFKKINLATDMVSTLVTLTNNTAVSPSPRGRVAVLAVHPSADIMYYMTCYNDVVNPNTPTRIHSVDLNTLVVKRYAGGGVTTVGVAADTLEAKFGQMETARAKPGVQPLTDTTMVSTVCDSNAAFTGSAIFNDLITGMDIDRNGYIFVVGQILSRVWMVSPVPPAQAPSRIFTVVATLNSVTIGWSDDTNATSYTFTISPSPPSIAMPVVVPPATTATFTGLIDTTLYTIGVIASNRLGTASPGTIVCGTGIDTTNFALLPPVTSSINVLTSGTPSVVSVGLMWTGISRVRRISYTITPWGSATGASAATGATGATGATELTEAKGPPITGMQTVPQGSSQPQPLVVSGLQPNTTYRATITGSVPNPPSFSGATTDIFSATSNAVTFTTAPLNPVFLGTVAGPGSFVANASGPTPMTTPITGNPRMAQDAERNLYITRGTYIYKIAPAASSYFLFDTSQSAPTATQLYNTPVGFPGSTMSIFAGGPTQMTSPASSYPLTATGAAIRFNNIGPITYSRSENCLYVVEVDYYIIVKVTLTAPITATYFAGSGILGWNYGGRGAGSFGLATDITVRSNNELILSDFTYNTMRSLTLTGVLGRVTPVYSLMGINSQVEMPDGSFLVTCTNQHVIRKATPSVEDPNTYNISLYTGIENTPGNVDGPLATARFNRPRGLILDSAYNVYVYDSDSFAIRVIIGSNVYTYLGGTGLGSVNGPAATAKFTCNKMHFDTNGTLYIADGFNGTVRAVTAYPMDLVITDRQLTNYRASAAQASSAVAQAVSAPIAQVASSALAQSISGARESSAVAQAVSSPIAQVASSALAQSISGAQESSAVAQAASSAVAQVASSAVAQDVSSALAQSISGAQESSAVAQVASSAVAQNVSSALAQRISGAQESSAVAQVASSALAQSISGAQESSSVAQVASSALAQSISGARHSSAVAERASSALAQSISGAQQSSAVAQVASSALAQSISGAQESSSVAQVASSALAQSISGARHSSAVAQADSSAQQQADSSAQQQAASSSLQQRDSSAQQQKASSSVQQADSSAQQQADSSAQHQAASSSLQQRDSSAQQQKASSSVQQADSSAQQQADSSARQQADSSARQQAASSSLQQRDSSAQQQDASSAVAQVASSALAQSISGAQQSSAVAQFASSALAQSISGAQESSAVAQTASSALAQSISGAQQSSAVAERASSALAQSISGAQQSSAVAQVASSALAQSISGARESSSVAQVASSALAQSISGARHSSAVAQADSSAQQQAASSSLQQADSSAQQQAASASFDNSASSAVAQVASSARQQADSSAQQQAASSSLQQRDSSAQQQAASSSVQQADSSAQQQAASSSVQQADSSAQQQTASASVEQRASSAVAQVASSALVQSISGAQQSSAVAQIASSALAQSISGAQQSSAVAQADSSAQAQRVSSSVQQRDSSAQQQAASSAQANTALGAAIGIKDDIKRDMAQLQADIATATQNIYTQNSSTASGSTLASLQTNLQALEQKKNDLMASARAIFQLNPTYQDSSLQTVIQDSTLSSFGVRKVFDALRNNYVFLNTSNAIVVSPLVPSIRAYTSGATQRGGGKKHSRKSACLFYYTSK
jgi:hypothetical protein